MNYYLAQYCLTVVTGEGHVMVRRGVGGGGGGENVCGEV